MHAYNLYSMQGKRRLWIVWIAHQKIYQSVSSKIMWRFQTPLGAECCKPSHNFWHPFPYIKQFPCSMLSSYILISNLNNLRNRIPTLYIYHIFALLSFYHRQLQLFLKQTIFCYSRQFLCNGLYIFCIESYITKSRSSSGHVHFLYIRALVLLKWRSFMLCFNSKAKNLPYWFKSLVKLDSYFQLTFRISGSWISTV